MSSNPADCICEHEHASCSYCPSVAPSSNPAVPDTSRTHPSQWNRVRTRALIELTVSSVRYLETHTDIGPGGVGPLLIGMTLAQHEANLRVLFDAGYVLSHPVAANCGCSSGLRLARGQCAVCPGFVRPEVAFYD